MHDYSNCKSTGSHFTILLHILPRWPTGLSLFAYLKGNLKSGFFHNFFINNLYLQGHQNEGPVEINGFSIKKPREKH